MLCIACMCGGPGTLATEKLNCGALHSCLPYTPYRKQLKEAETMY